MRELTSTLATLTSSHEGAGNSARAGEEKKKKVCFLQPGVRPPLGGTPGRGVIRCSSSLYIDGGRPPPRYLPFRGELTCQITKASELKSQKTLPAATNSWWDVATVVLLPPTLESAIVTRVSIFLFFFLYHIQHLLLSALLFSDSSILARIWHLLLDAEIWYNQRVQLLCRYA